MTQIYVHSSILSCVPLCGKPCPFVSRGLAGNLNVRRSSPFVTNFSCNPSTKVYSLYPIMSQVLPLPLYGYLQRAQSTHKRLNIQQPFRLNVGVSHSRTKQPSVYVQLWCPLKHQPFKSFYNTHRPIIYQFSVKLNELARRGFQLLSMRAIFLRS